MRVIPTPPESSCPIPGFAALEGSYEVLRLPAPLAGIRFPKQPDWGALARAGFRSVACLTGTAPPYDPTPLRIVHAVRLQDLYGGRLPDDPVREAGMLRDVVGAVLEELDAGRGVLVHCCGGTGRTGTVIACTLAALGMPKEEILTYMSGVNEARAESPGWPESDWQRDQVALFARPQG